MSSVDWNNSASFFGSPLPPLPLNKAGWAFTVNCSGIISLAEQHFALEPFFSLFFQVQGWLFGILTSVQYIILLVFIFRWAYLIKCHNGRRQLYWIKFSQDHCMFMLSCSIEQNSLHCNCPRLRFDHIYLFIYFWTEVLWFIYLVDWTLACIKCVYYQYYYCIKYL